MASIFTRILRGEVPCEKILESDRLFAFLDIRPIAPGHTLVIPKAEIDDVFDLAAETLAEMLPFAQRVAAALKRAVPCRRVGMMVAGFEVPHAHLHLVPLQQESDLSFSRAQPSNPAVLKAVGDAIRAALD